MNPTHISEFAAKAQWALGGMGAFGSGWFTFLSENYRAIGSLGVLVGVVVGIHGAYWLWRVKSLEAERERLELERLKRALL